MKNIDRIFATSAFLGISFYFLSLAAVSPAYAVSNAQYNQDKSSYTKTADGRVYIPLSNGADVLDKVTVVDCGVAGATVTFHDTTANGILSATNTIADIPIGVPNGQSCLSLQRQWFLDHPLREGLVYVKPSTGNVKIDWDDINKSTTT